MSGRAAWAAGVLLLLGLGGPLAACGEEPARSAAPGLGSLTASGAGHRFYEIYEPAGRARGTMLMLHSGGWRDQRGDARRIMASTAVTFRARGWRVVNVSHSPGPRPRGRPVDPRPMVRDVVAFYDQIRRAYDGPVCAYGESAGGHLAAMLAIKRPSLTCAVLAAAPLDLGPLLRQSSAAGAEAIRATFGTSRAVLEEWSPARHWGPGNTATRVFATGASNDAVVTPGQLTSFTAVAPAADALVLPGADAGSGDAVTWMHSTVGRRALDARLASLDRWLDDVVPRRTGTRGPATGTGTDCDRPRADRSRLLLAGGAWRQASTTGQAIAATRGCSGSARRQDDGLSLWAFPSPGALLPPGAQAALVLDPGRAVRRLSASFRGFLARPQDWTVGLYASTRTRGRISTPVAACDRGRCSRLRLVGTDTGALIAALGERGDPDRREHPLRAQFTLPPGTRRLAWRLRCVAAAGCSLTGPVTAAGGSTRRRDRLAHPAILSLYRVSVR